jgi:hypothetical protein
MPTDETFTFADAPPKQSHDTSPPELEKLLDWLINHWLRPRISLAEIYTFGPRCIRNRKRALELAGVLEKHRWLELLESHRRDRQQWRIIRGPTPIPLTDRISATTTSARLPESPSSNPSNISRVA